MAGMQLAGRMLVHQVHPAKIGADVTAAAMSNILLWKARPKAALVVRVLLPVAGSAAVLGLADLDALAKTRRGQYVLTHMPPSAQAVRLAGDALTGLGGAPAQCRAPSCWRGRDRDRLVACGVAANVQPGMILQTSNERHRRKSGSAESAQTDRSDAAARTSGCSRR